MEFLDNQRPLSLRWASKDAAEYLRQEAGLSPSAAAIAFDLTRTPYQQVSYPRAKDHKSYRCARRYKNPIWTPGRVIGGMNELAKAAWVDHFKQIQGERSAGIQSFAQAMPELVELTAEALTF
ncbi:hypothetical protein, partial [Palleronia sp.]|uniref:hypothetical protein n=1 Tax=Palleronia sp. TaxID=1940284 RepID=UPI0035C808DE